jgi:Antidote-toxin recognition MazE, bacterial antitoxin
METEMARGRPNLPSEYRPRFRTVRLHRSGNSLGIYIPKVIAEQVGIGKHDELRMYVVGRVICLQAVSRDSFTPGVLAMGPAAVDPGAHE